MVTANRARKTPLQGSQLAFDLKAFERLEGAPVDLGHPARKDVGGLLQLDVFVVALFADTSPDLFLLGFR